MKQVIKILYVVLVMTGHTALCQSVLGKWKTVDDETGEGRSIVELYERSGKVYGRVSKLLLFPNGDHDPICVACDEDDPRYKKKIIGMEIITDMVRDGDEYTGGKVLDPKSGKIYTCKLWIEGKNLKLRGYIGPFYRTQTWMRAE